MRENPNWDPREAKKARKAKKANKRARSPQKRAKKKKKRRLRNREDDAIQEQQQMLDNELFPGEADFEEDDIGIEPSVYDKTVMALKSKPKKRKNDDEDLNIELEAYSKQFVTEMILAAKHDREGLLAKPPKPAFACFKMMNKLEENLQRGKLLRLMLENNLLCALRD